MFPFVGSCVYHAVPESTLLLRDSVTMAWTCCGLSSDWLVYCCSQAVSSGRLGYCQKWFSSFSAFLASVRNLGLVFLCMSLMLASEFRVVGGPLYPQALKIQLALREKKLKPKCISINCVRAYLFVYPLDNIVQLLIQKYSKK